MKSMSYLGIALALLAIPTVAIAKPISAVLYKSPQCGCCEDYAAYLRGNGFEGHVPVKIIQNLLSERPAVAGITLPGMPAGSPGMNGNKTAPFTVYAITKDGKSPTVYSSE